MTWCIFFKHRIRCVFKSSSIFLCVWTSEWTEIVSSLLPNLSGFFDSEYFLYCPRPITCKSTKNFRVLKCHLYKMDVIQLNHSVVNHYDFFNVWFEHIYESTLMARNTCSKNPHIQNGYSSLSYFTMYTRICTMK